MIGEKVIDSVFRENGPSTTSVQWTAQGRGEMRVYAVIDPENTVDEMHDGDDLINNNVAYGVVNIGAADYVDPGLTVFRDYYAVTYAGAGAGSQSNLSNSRGVGATSNMTVSVNIPTASITETTRIDLKSKPISGLDVIGDPFTLDAFQGNTPIRNMSQRPGSLPALISIEYGDGDVAGVHEGRLTLYRLTDDGTSWIEATCAGYTVQRFLEDNLLIVPVCQTGTFALNDEVPGHKVFLPLVVSGY
jgi:hypothetical protein